MQAQNKIALILLRHHKGIVAEVERLPRASADAERVLRGERELVGKLENLLGKTKAASK